VKTILVSQRLVGNTGYAEIREALDVQWGLFLNQCGLLPVPIATHVPVKSYFDALKPAGILLTGGNDLSVFAPQDPLSGERDRVEQNLIELAIKHSLPIIGICRGAQMLAHTFGAKLEKKEGHVTASHTVQIDSATRIFDHYQKTALDVNSYHNYCVTQLGEEFNAAAKHTDQTIEAFEHKSRPLYGLLWHPERCHPFSHLDIQFFKKVFDS